MTKRYLVLGLHDHQAREFATYDEEEEALDHHRALAERYGSRIAEGRSNVLLVELSREPAQLLTGEDPRPSSAWTVRILRVNLEP